MTPLFPPAAPPVLCPWGPQSSFHTCGTMVSLTSTWIMAFWYRAEITSGEGHLLTWASTERGDGTWCPLIFCFWYVFTLIVLVFCSFTSFIHHYFIRYTRLFCFPLNLKYQACWFFSSLWICQIATNVIFLHALDKAGTVVLLSPPFSASMAWQRWQIEWSHTVIFLLTTELVIVQTLKTLPNVRKKYIHSCTVWLQNSFVWYSLCSAFF